jgi:hypothetical protein
MDTAISFLLLFIFAILIFGVPILLIAIRLFETISERRESIRPAEDESMAGENPIIEKKATNNAGEWTPAKNMR